MKYSLLLAVSLLLYCAAIPTFAMSQDNIMQEDEKYQLAIDNLPFGNSKVEPNCCVALDILIDLANNGYEKAITLLRELYNKGYSYWGDYDLRCNYDLGELGRDEIELLLSESINGDYLASLLLAYHCKAIREHSQCFQYFSKCVKNINRVKNVNVKLQDQDFEPILAQIEAVANLAYSYEHGYGVAQDLSKAESLYLAIGGDYYFPETDYSIANEYEGLTCVSQSIDGFMPSPSCIRIWAKTGIILLKNNDYERANLYYKTYEEDLPAEPSSCGAVNLLWIAERYYQGMGVKKDIGLAIKYLRLLVDEECGPWATRTYEYFPTIYADACYRLYEYYSELNNHSFANKYYKSALQFGSSSAIHDEINKRGIQSIIY